MATWSGTTTASSYHGFVFTELNDNLAGPFKYPRLTAATNMPDNGLLVGVTEKDDILWTDLEKLRDVKFDSVADPFTTTDISSAWDVAATYNTGDLVAEEPVPPATEWGIYRALQDDFTTHALDATDYWEPYYDFVVGNPSGVFSYYGKKITSAFAEPEKEANAAVTDCLFFRDAYLSVAETGPMHLSSEHEIKQMHEVVFSFKTNSVGHLWCYAENEDGQVQGQYKASIYDKHRIKVFMNLRGREFRIRVYMMTHVNHPWQIQEVAIGHLIGKAFT